MAVTLTKTYDGRYVLAGHPQLHRRKKDERLSVGPFPASDGLVLVERRSQSLVQLLVRKAMPARGHRPRPSGGIPIDDGDDLRTCVANMPTGPPSPSHRLTG